MLQKNVITSNLKWKRYVAFISLESHLMNDMRITSSVILRQYSSYYRMKCPKYKQNLNNMLPFNL